MDQAVVPFAGAPAASTQRKAAPPHSWTSIPRWILYQERSLAGSLALKKTPPIPVTRFMDHLPNNHAFRYLTVKLRARRKRRRGAAGAHYPSDGRRRGRDNDALWRPVFPLAPGA